MSALCSGPEKLGQGWGELFNSLFGSPKETLIYFAVICIFFSLFFPRPQPGEDPPVTNSVHIHKEQFQVQMD